MALYIPAGRRRRRLYLAAGLSLLVGLVLGIGLGRVTAPTPVDNARDAKQLAKSATGQLEAFPIHYEQVAKGEIDRNGFYASLDAGVKRAGDDLASAMGGAPWLDESTKGQLRAEVQNVKNVADRNAPASEFDAAVRRAVGAINAAFGAPVASSTTTSRPG